MESNFWSFIIHCCLLFLHHLPQHNCQHYKNEIVNSKDPQRAKKINDYIYGLEYDKDQILTYFGEKVSSVPAEGKLDDNKNFIVITREKKYIDSGKADIGVLSSNEHRTYPGALLLANSRLLDNEPDYVSIDRSKITYTIDLPGMQEGEGSFSIAPTYGNYKAAHDKVLNVWFDNYSSTHDIIARFQSDRTLVYSQDQIRVAFGIDFKYSSVESGIDFSDISSQKKTVMVFKFKQIFYTVSVQAPIKPSDVFGSDVSVGDISKKMNSDNPPILVDSVSYGRSIYVKIETTSTDNDAKIALQNKLTGFDVDISTEMEIKQKCKDLNIAVYVMGGGSQHIELITATTFKQVTDVIIKYRKLSRDNLGYPTSYSTQFLKDNSKGIVKGSTEYTESTKTVFEKGVLKIIHNGWYVAQWAVSWDEVSYDEQGHLNTVRNGWYRNWKSLTAPFSEDIQLAGNCRNVAVFARERTGLVWQKWRTVINFGGIQLIKYRSFKIYGTTLNPRYSIEPQLSNNKYGSNNGNFTLGA